LIRSYSSLNEDQRRALIEEIRREKEIEQQEELDKAPALPQTGAMKRLINIYGTKMAHLVRFFISPFAALLMF
jgi:hypothetical protein